MSDRDALRERRRVLLLFAISVLPPFLLLVALGLVALRNDEAALTYVEQERARQAAEKARGRLLAALERAEASVFAAFTPSAIEALEAGGPQAEATARALRDEHPLAAALFVLDGGGHVLWPAPDLPFLDPVGVPVPNERFAVSEGQDFRRLAELQALYDRAVVDQRGGQNERAARALRVVCEDPEATPTLAARAAFRLAECLLAQGRQEEARRAYARAAAAEEAVRDDELGRPLRSEAREAIVRLANEAGRREEAVRALNEFAQALLGGGLRGDLREDEWFAAVARAAALARGLEEGELARRLGQRSEQLREVLRWTRLVEREAEALLLQALRSPGEPRTHVVAGRPPTLLSCKARGEDGRPRLIGFRMDPERLARDVLTPVCAELSTNEGATVAVLDAGGEVRAHGAADEAVDLAGGTAVKLEPLPWEVRAVRPTAALEQARRNRLLLYGSLIVLSLASALVGAAATIRYVSRSLELARMKSDFLSNITHELKTPLTSIKMYGEMIAAGRLRSDEKRQEYASHIVREGDRLQKLIENVLDFARQDSGQHDYVLAEEDVADTVREAIDLFRLSAKARGFDLYVDLPPVGALPPVDLDRDAIVRSVLNLLSNAVKYSTDRRYIKVTVRREDRALIAVAVEDRGIGIAAEDLDKIFERFYRAGDELTRGVSGAGLGLALVDHIVRAHHGQIQVESQRGQGSVFTILLPIVEDYREQWPPPEDPDPAQEEEATERAGSA